MSYSLEFFSLVVGVRVNHKYKNFSFLSMAGVAQWIEWPGCEPKGHRFNSQSGHMPGLRNRFPVGGAWEATTH